MMLKKTVLNFIFLAFASILFAQSDYFQQEVNYDITVTLDDKKHELDGHIKMTYTNRAPEALEQIYLHLWANAYKNRETAFARQQLQHNNTRFYFAKEETLGNFSKLDFRINGEAVNWNYDPKHPDIAILELAEPLASGATLTIESPFLLKIPGSFSRLGHVGESYQLTQWYPKPAVYDRDGWHPMPYLDMGEFYSEFGRFKVSITLPKNYVVGATGELQNQEELDFLMRKAEETETFFQQVELPETDTFPSSSTEMKTLVYRAEQVHDFAWFADKRFHVQKSEVTLASGRTINTWTMFTNAEADLWQRSIEYVDRAVQFYSEKVGEYPYPQATAVQSALSAGGGMEYPMITVIGLSGDAQALDEVITHEVGHNWFYGILAFDERDHAWLDEGLNSYYDHRYTAQYYGSDGLELLPDFVMRTTDYDLLDLSYLFQARRELDQAPETSSDDFERYNYFLGAYEKPARIFRYLEQYLGTSTFDPIMQDFYQKWAFKHPQPEDLRQHLEQASGKDLSWLFDGLINSNQKIDYAIGKVKRAGDNYEIEIKNKGDLAAPFSLGGLRGDSVLQRQWYDGFKGSKTIQLSGTDYNSIVLDDERHALDVDRRNNQAKTSGLFPKVEPLRLRFLAGVESSQHTNLYWTPLVTWNNYDKTMLGLALYNTSIPANRFEFALAPQYSLVTNDLNGLANVKYNLFLNNDWFRKVTFDVGWKSYHYEDNLRLDYNLKYHRLAPTVRFELGRPEKSNFSQIVQVRTLFIFEELPEFVDGTYTGNRWERSLIHQLEYTGEARRALHPFSYKFRLEQQSYDFAGNNQNYLKASAEGRFAYTYNRGKNIWFRVFGGYFLVNDRRDANSVSSRFSRGSFALTHQSFNDYQYDHFFFGRTDQSGIWSHQISLEEGGMKNAFGSAFNSSFGLGQSNNFILALNIKADLPVDLPLDIPLKPFFDVGYFDDARPIADGVSLQDQVLWSGGLMLDFFDGILGVYFPLVHSDNMDLPYSDRAGGDYVGKITFSLDLHRLNPWRMIDRIRF